MEIYFTEKGSDTVLSGYHHLHSTVHRGKINSLTIQGSQETMLHGSRLMEPLCIVGGYYNQLEKLVIRHTHDWRQEAVDALLDLITNNQNLKILDLYDSDVDLFLKEIIEHIIEKGIGLTTFRIHSGIFEDNTPLFESLKSHLGPDFTLVIED